MTDDFEPIYDFSAREDICVEMDNGEILIHWIKDTKPEDRPRDYCGGSCSHEKDYGCLDYLIEAGTDKGVYPYGYWVLENCQVGYWQDSWTGEGDCSFECYGDIRPARLWEIDDKITPRLIWEQLLTALKWKWNGATV